MPIYEYRCTSCGHQQEFLQKVSDPQLTECTACGKPTFAKMLTAAGFQLKGSGWYATDFKSKGAAPSNTDGDKAGGDKPSGDKPDGGKKSDPGGEGPATSSAACGAGACPACQ